MDSRVGEEVEGQIARLLLPHTPFSQALPSATSILLEPVSFYPHSRALIQALSSLAWVPASASSLVLWPPASTLQ